MGIHGGDVYRNDIVIDFSTNINPLGIPQCVKTALHQAVEICDKYPDIEADRLKQTVSRKLGIPREYLLFGNGASELLMAIVHGIKPKKTVILVPSFYGYEYAAKAIDSEIIYYQMQQEDRFCVTEDLYRVLTKEIDLLFLAHPNNPTGNLWQKQMIRQLLQHCEEQGIYVVLDECFIEFSGSQHSMLPEIEVFSNLILVRAFTKIFAVPGVRIGYLICKNQDVLAKLTRQLPEWNLSCFAQEAGCVCIEQTEFLLQTERYVAKERQFLQEEFRKKGFLVFPSMANFILFYSEKHLYEQLLKKGILIRDCSNFRGLGKGFYRIAVKKRTENEILLESLQ